jgi:glyceraldehyde 3-phosphate dehydrogenase
MTVRVAINGFGRIGRNIVRAIAESGRKDIAVVAVNDLAPVETNAHLLRFDSVHGRFPGEVKVEGDSISLGNGKIKVTAIKDPTTLPWKDLGVDIARRISMPAPSAFWSRRLPTARISPWSMGSITTS